MGRYLLFICSGLVIILGLVKISTQNRQIELVKRSATAADRAQARNMANEAIDMTIQKLDNDPSWRNGYQPWSVTLDYGTASVQIIDNTSDKSLKSNQLKLISTSVLNKNTATVQTLVQREGGLPTITSAMSFYSNNINFNANGASFQINGNDTNPDGSKGSGSAVPGVTVPGEDGYNAINNTLKKNQQNDIIGAGGNTPNISTDSSLDPAKLNKIISKIAQNADKTYYGGHYSGLDLGSESNPQITVINGDMKLTGSTEGYGILIIQNSNLMNFAGNFHFNGLVVMMGGTYQSNGNIHLNGSLLLGTSSSQTSYGATIKGNVNINYSSQALQLIQQKLSNKLNMHYVKVSTYE